MRPVRPEEIKCRLTIQSFYCQLFIPFSSLVNQQFIAIRVPKPKDRMQYQAKENETSPYRESTMRSSVFHGLSSMSELLLTMTIFQNGKKSRPI